jgi:hypothetical protein
MIFILCISNIQFRKNDCGNAKGGVSRYVYSISMKSCCARPSLIRRDCHAFADFIFGNVPHDVVGCHRELPILGGTIRIVDGAMSSFLVVKVVDYLVARFDYSPGLLKGRRRCVEANTGWPGQSRRLVVPIHESLRYVYALVDDQVITLGQFGEPLYRKKRWSHRPR